MSNPNQNDAAQARARAREIAQRLENEPAFRDQVRESPVSTLTAAGLPEQALPDFLREINVEPEVSGYMMMSGCGHTCEITCYEDTCDVTAPSAEC